MEKKAIRPFGTWTSPLGPEQVAQASLRFGHLQMDGETIYWLENQPGEGGRGRVMGVGPNEQPRVISPPEFNVRSRIQEYGGGDFCVHGPVLVFCNDSDQRLYRSDRSGRVSAITPPAPENRQWRYGNLQFDPGGAWILGVRESLDRAGNSTHDLVCFAAQGSKPPLSLTAGRDFYLAPRLSPNGRHLAWICRDQPHMPWDCGELWLADFDPHEGLSNAHRIAGNNSVSVLYPEWSPDGQLYFVSDQNGWWNIFRYQKQGCVAITTEAAEFSPAPGSLGSRAFVFVEQGLLAAIYRQDGQDRLCLIDERSNRIVFPAPGWVHFPGYLAVGKQTLAFVAGRSDRDLALIRFDLDSGHHHVLRQKGREHGCLNTVGFSPAESICFPSGKGGSAFGFFYAPQNNRYRGPKHERPPLLVFVHGGPTGLARPHLDPEVQFWTQRGFAVLDVNYRGSLGYGRSYREKLRGRWGQADVEDCIAGAKYLIARDRVDAGRLAIRGKSAGGFTVLCALAFHDFFHVGTSYYGIADLERLAAECHKLEARYLDSLIGGDNQKQRLHDRSPIHHLEGFNRPVLILQGSQDRVVPPNQARLLAEALRAKKLPHACHFFPDEQHGFRKAESIGRALKLEWDFYRDVWHMEGSSSLKTTPGS